MKRSVVFLGALLFLLVGIYADVSPINDTLGPIATEDIDGSILDFSLKALYSSFDDDWIERYASDDPLFLPSYSKTLSSILPMKNLVASQESDGMITFLSLETGDIVTLVIKEGRVYSVFLEN